MADINFIILKINGIDVSEMPHNEAVQMFLKAPEPMMLEVRRPTADDLNKFYISSANIPVVSLSSKSTCLQKIDEKYLKSPVKKCPDIVLVDDEKDSNKKFFVTTGVQTDTVLTEYIFSGSSIDDQSNEHIFDECLSPEIDIEEVTLRKAASNEKLGLTVSYSSGSDDTDTCTEVYISDIIPNSVAGRDGRLRQGDQILQVNGRDVLNKTDTETLIAENKNAVTFLVSRYLYTDDDFNEAYDDYDNDERNLTYQNCMITKNCLADIRSSSDQTNTSSTSKSSSSHKSAVDKEKKIVTNAKELISKFDPLNHFNIEAHLESVNHELSLLDSRVESMMLHNSNSKQAIVARPPATINSDETAQIASGQNQNTYIYRIPIDNMKKLGSNVAEKPTTDNKIVPTKCPIVLSRKKHIDSDTEHIYETIPEDTESEPFYCLPYETADQNIVEQWLEMQAGNETPTKLQRRKPQPKNVSGSSSKYLLGQQQQLKSTMKSNSSGEDHENSSSAYNTGGSCNSNNHLTLELNSNGDGCDKGGNQRSIAVLYPTTAQQQHPQQQTDNTPHGYVQDINDNCEECQRQKKEKTIVSPKHDQQKSPQKLMHQQQRLMMLQQQQQQHQSSHTFCSSQTQPQRCADSSFKTSPKIAADTMYTNMANLKRTMLLQQKLFRQALIRQNAGITTNTTTQATYSERPHFNAPNLSQYHFVSSQEVSASTIKQHPCDEQMEWKVKRRQDGTRYIVRRPTRNRILRDRAIRITAERNELTTEDDTISEIKTGRYWTKDERKKHFERAKERRLRQQLIILNKCESDNNTVTKIQQQQQQQQQRLPNGQQTQQSLPAGGILNRSATIGANVPIIQTTTPTIDCQTLHKKSMKKKKKDENPTITDNGNKILGLLSVTTV